MVGMNRALVVLLVAACGAPPAPAEPEAPTTEPTIELGAVEATLGADARRLETFVPHLRAASAADRGRAVLGLARLHDPSAAPHLLRALRDPDPGVRRHASLGLGALGVSGPSELALLGAIATERDPATRAEHLWDLGRVGSDASLTALREALTADAPEERRAACDAVASYALDRRTLAEELMSRVARQVGDDRDRAVRIACAHAILRAPATAGLGADLGRALPDPDPEVRAMVVRALGRGADTEIATLVPLLEDPDWDVVVQAFRALGTRAEAERPLASALRALHVRVLAALDEPRALNALLGAMEALPPSTARTTAVSQAAQALFSETAPSDPNRAMLHCALARLVDLGRGWPSRVDRCGGEHVEPAERQRLAAEIVGLLEGAERERTAYLTRLLGAEPPIVREAVAGALGAMTHADGRAHLLTLAADPDEGVVIAAIDALAQRFRAAVAARDAAALDALLRGAAEGVEAGAEAGAVEADAWPDAAVLEAVQRASERFREADDLEGLVTVLGAVRAARDLRLGPVALGLALHHALAVREAAHLALEDLELAPPEGHPAPPPNPITEAELVGTDPILVELATSRGDVVLELRPDWAPTTVARFVGLVRAGFYDGLTFHRVVPAFVAQAGDPRGDGYGGPGWSQRCEDNRVRYERGTVGMALAGRDTGGSQFFITLTPQPHLDGRYTAFARVREGMENAERLTRGDVIHAATVRE